MLAIDLHLPRHTTAWDKASTQVERLRTCVACSHVDDQLLITGRPRECERVRRQLLADALPAPLTKNMGAKLSNVIHGSKEFRPLIEALEANDLPLRCLGQEHAFTSGQRFEVFAFAFGRERAINCRVNLLGDNRLPHSDDARCIIWHPASD